MAFDGTKFARASAHNNHNSLHLWTYKNTGDDDATVQTADYFLSKYLDLAVGDVIFTYTSDGSAILKVATCTSAGVTIGVIDTD